MLNSGLLGTFAVIYSLQILAEAYLVNVALNKSGKYCDIRQVSKLIFDGDTNYRNSEKFLDSCSRFEHAHIKISLVELHSIQHVVIYHGAENYRRQLDFFEVQFNEYAPSGEKNSELCSEYPFRALAPGQALRMNCKPNGKLFLEVQMNSKINKGFDIAEIELQTLAKGLPTVRNVLIHKGCFRNFGSVIELLNFAKCQKKCLREGYSFIGTKADSYCGCDNSLDAAEEVSPQVCDYKCDDGFRFCGSDNSYSVYIVKPPLPWYNGCYKLLKPIGDKTTIGGSMTQLKCLTHCDGFQFAILQNGNYCFCDNDEWSNDLKVSSGDCDEPCTGDDSTTCGGLETVAIYSTCKQGKKSKLTCSQLFQCEVGYPYDIFGMCGRCKPGFIGKHCLEFSNETEGNNISLPGDEDDFDLFWPFVDAKLKEVLPFVLPFLSLMIFGIIIYILASTKRSESITGSHLTRFGKVSIVTIN